MKEQPDFSEDFKNALEPTTSVVDEIETRACGNGNGQYGVQYSIIGGCINVRPIIDVVSNKESFAIDHIMHVDEGEPRLIVYVADLRSDSDHPAFT